MKVYVYPDGENYEEPPTSKSDDFEIRETDVCQTCNEVLHIHYAEPLASCSCYTQEWHK
jgi:hypothetical protein